MNKTVDEIYKEVNALTRKVLCTEEPEVKEMSLAYNRDISDEARALHKDLIIIDTCTFNLEGDSWHLDEGGLTAIGSTVPKVKDRAGEAMCNIVDYYQAVEDGSRLMHAFKADDIVTAKKLGKVACIIGSQNGDFMNHADIPAAVDFFESIGMRIMQIAYNHRSFAADGCYSPSNAGLSAEGRVLVEAMEDCGMTVDLSHIGWQSAADAIDMASKPLIFSHSNPYALFRHQRNIPDALATAIADKGGVIGACAFRSILWDGEHFPTINEFLRCVRYWIDLVGVEHVGIGLDSNTQQGAYLRRDQAYSAKIVRMQGGTNSMQYRSYMAGRGYLGCFTDGIESLANFPNIVDKMLKFGFSEYEIRKVCGENWLRVFRDTWKN